MRDIDRLDNLYYELKKIHENFPDWRFGQFIVNFTTWFHNKYHRDFFYIEDNNMLYYIKKFIKEMKGD